MWRPDKKVWARGKREHCEITVGDADCEHCPTNPMECDTGFEAGADAMLKALRVRGFIIGESLRNTGGIGWQTIDPKSKWYSIPDDKDEEESKE